MLNATIFVILCLIWGSTWLAIKVGLDGSPPFLGAGFRFTIASGFLFLLCAVFARAGFSFKRKWPMVLLAGISMYPLPYGLVYWGSQYVESGMAAVLFAIMPFIVALLAYLIIGTERLTAAKMAGMVVGFGGIILIFADNLNARGGLGIWGMAAIVFSSFFSSLATVLSKRHFNDINPLPLTAVQTAIGAVTLTGLGVLTESLSDYRTDVKTIGSLLYLGIMGTAAAFSLYLFLLKKMEATKLATIAFITPLVALLLGMAVRREKFDAMSIAGSLMVVGGVFVAVVGDNLLKSRRRAINEMSAARQTG
jgi:drug/metabolite transporter (DMT)-like permease